ncbi:MAG: immunoglobulin-like domain-containing protein, partial [Opitutae bacterium]
MPGTYSLKYTVVDSAGNSAEAIRTVKVIDTTPPTIELIGSDIETIGVGSLYVEAGYIASDSSDGDLTSKVTVDSPEIDLTRTGIYEITYSVSDSSGNSAEAVRMVIVQHQEFPVHAHWRFDETNGFIASDSSGNGHHGLLKNFSSVGAWGVGQKGNALNFDGTNDFVELPAGINVPSEMTLSTWIRREGSLENRRRIFFWLKPDNSENGAGFVSGINDISSAGNAVWFVTRRDTSTGNRNYYNSYSSDPNAFYPQGEWVHLAISYSTKNKIFATYRNGELVSEKVGNGMLLSSNSTGAIGFQYNANRNFFSGGMDDVAIIGAVLSPEQIAWIADGGDPRSLPLDLTPPLLTLIGENPITHEMGTPFIDPGTSAVDDIDGTISNLVQIAGGPVDSSIIGTYTLTYSISDSAGNSALPINREVSVVDSTLPVITLRGEAEITVSALSNYIDPGAIATDFPDEVLTSSIVVTNRVDTSVAGDHTVAYNVTDAAGNKAIEVLRKVTVVDDKPPVITLLGEALVKLDEGVPYSDAGAKAVDAAEGDIEVKVDDPVNFNKPGTYTVTYTAKDSSGNEALPVTRTVIVLDKTPPVITLKGESAVVHEGGTDYVDAGATALDSEDGDISDKITVTGVIDLKKLGEQTLSFNVTDISENPAVTVTRTVTVVDTTAPVLALNGIAAIEVLKDGTYTELGATATDSVEGDISDKVIVGGETVDTATLGDYVVTYDVTDSSGNKGAQISRTVTVTLTPDETAPVITLTGDANFAAEAGENFTDPGAKAYDDRDGDITARLLIVGTVDSTKPDTYPITYNVTDSAGNKATEVVRTVTVEDTTAPIITLNGEAEIGLEVGSEYTDLGASALDSFEGDLTASITSSGTVDINKPGSYEIKFNVADSNGNQAVETVRIITVADTTPPVLVLEGEAEITHEAVTDYTDAGAKVSDNFDSSIDVLTAGAVDTKSLGSYTLTYSATDAAGNKAPELTRKVTVVDTTSPVITLEGEAELVLEFGATFTDPGAVAQDTLDGDLTGAVSSA